MEEEKKLSLSFCKNFLKKLGKNYTDEQVSQIRDTLYIFAELDYLITTKKRLPKVESDLKKPP